MLGPPEPQFVEKNNLRVPVYRYYAWKNEEARFHYHTNPVVGNGWIKEGIAFYGAYELNPNSIPLYNFYYDYKTTGKGGWKFLLGTDMGAVNGGWTFNGTLCKVFQNQEAGKGAVPIYKYSFDEGDGI